MPPWPTPNDDTVRAVGYSPVRPLLAGATQASFFRFLKGAMLRAPLLVFRPFFLLKSLQLLHGRHQGPA